ncbi:rhamnulokinase [Mycolicibacterium sp. CBM1]
MTAGHVAAVDLGASSGRVVLAQVGPGQLEMTTVARFPNEPVSLWDGSREALHWNVTGLYGQLCAGVAAAARQAGPLTGIGVDSWAVDYGLLRDGRLLGQPRHYRDGRGRHGVDSVHSVVDEAELYRRNGLQFLPFNTVYQLAADCADGLLDTAEKLLLIPDLITYWLTGQYGVERTNASTTGLLGIDGQWDTDLLHRLRLRPGLLPDIVETGSTRGPVLPEVAARLVLDAGTEVVSVASHDTASAVVAVPMRSENAAYISCGTWGLVGVELTQPLVTPAARAANFTNEVGADGRIRFLHNVIGLWLLSETVRQYERQGVQTTLAALLDQAAQAPAPADVFDTNDPAFLAPGDIPGRVREWYAGRDLPAPVDPATTVRAIVESLAAAFAETVHTAAQLAGTTVSVVHIVGGGAQNALLCQLTADRLGLPVLAGPVEATALGNVMVTARARGLVSGDLEALRAIVGDHYPPRRYQPRARSAAATTGPAGCARPPR